MASKVTNDRKRREMKDIMEGVFAKGWKPAEVAAVIGVTPSNISSWKAGKNMGTNDARAALAALPGRDTSFAKDMMEKVVERAMTSLIKLQATLNDYASEAYYQKLLNDRAESNLHSIEYHTRELAASHAKAAEAQRLLDIRNAAVGTPVAAIRNWEAESLMRYTAEKSYENKTMTSYEWDVKHHTESLAECQAKTQETFAAEAHKDQANAIEWQTKVVAKAAKHLKDMEKVLAKW
jgi:transcriptional regulator with XRE-family HTH domain